MSSLVDKRLAGPGGLMTEVARRLSGRPVVVDLVKTATPGRLGTFTRSEGQGYIRVDPHLTPDLTLYVLLHEAAHCLLHWSRISATALHLAAPGTAQEGRPPVFEEGEEEADELAQRWLNYATQGMAIDEDLPDILDKGLERLLTLPGGANVTE